MVETSAEHMGRVGHMGDTVRWGILATGGIAERFTTDLRTLDGAEVVAVASRKEASAKAFADRFGIPRAYGDWAGLYADEDVDVVYVATPHHAHREAAGRALEAGKAVLCEKALTLNAREAEELVTLSRDRGLFLMEAMWMYCNPLIRRIAELVREGAIGEIRTVQADFVWLRLGERTLDFAAECERHGVMVRPFAGEGVRVTIGETEANDLFLKAAEGFRKEG